MPTVVCSWFGAVASAALSFASRCAAQWTRQAKHPLRGAIPPYNFRDSVMHLFCVDADKVSLSEWGATSAFLYGVLCAPDKATGIKLPDGHDDGSLRVGKVGIGSTFVSYVSSLYRGWVRRLYLVAQLFVVEDMEVVGLPGYRDGFRANHGTGGVGPIEAGFDAKM